MCEGMCWRKYKRECAGEYVVECVRVVECEREYAGECVIEC